MTKTLLLKRTLKVKTSDQNPPRKLQSEKKPENDWGHVICYETTYLTAWNRKSIQFYHFYKILSHDTPTEENSRKI